MIVVYIAGPYRDPRGEHFVRQNIRAAEDAALWVWKSGGVALCPHKNTAGFGGAAPDPVWLKGDLELLRRSDVVWAIGGWRSSAGAEAEVALAERIGKPVVYSLPEMLDFLKGKDQE